MAGGCPLIRVPFVNWLCVTTVNGNVYQGQFKNDAKEGMGVFYFKDGSRSMKACGVMTLRRRAPTAGMPTRRS